MCSFICRNTCECCKDTDKAHDYDQRQERRVFSDEDNSSNPWRYVHCIHCDACRPRRLAARFATARSNPNFNFFDLCLKSRLLQRFQKEPLIVVWPLQNICIGPDDRAIRNHGLHQRGVIDLALIDGLRGEE